MNIYESIYVKQNKFAGILFFAEDTQRFLLCKRSEYVEEPHTWSNIGGRIEQGENYEDCAKREAEEELQYYEDIKLIKAYIFKPQGKDFEYQNYIGVVPNEFIPKLNWESTDYTWVTVDELYDFRNLTGERIHFGLELLLKESRSLIYGVVGAEHF